MGTKAWMAEFIATKSPDEVARLVGHVLSEIYARQTHGEQATGSTKENNSVGFTWFDAKSGSQDAKAFEEYGTLAKWRVDRWLRHGGKVGTPRICKYHGQLSIELLENKLYISPPAVVKAENAAGTELERIRQAYIRVRGLFNESSNCPKADFDALVQATVSTDATPSQWVAAAQAITVPCRRCACTGQYVTGTLNGKPTGPGGICFRCEGKGRQNHADAKRNWGYDRNPRLL